MKKGKFCASAPWIIHIQWQKTFSEGDQPFPLENLMGIIARMKQKGVLVKTMGMALELAPPLIIDKQDIDEVIPILDACIFEEEQSMGLMK